LEAGLSAQQAQQCMESIDSKEVKTQLRTNVADAVDAGAFGAPFFVIDDHIYFGSDRFEQMAFTHGWDWVGPDPTRPSVKSSLWKTTTTPITTNHHNNNNNTTTTTTDTNTNSTTNNNNNNTTTTTNTTNTPTPTPTPPTTTATIAVVQNDPLHVPNDSMDVWSDLDMDLELPDVQLERTTSSDFDMHIESILNGFEQQHQYQHEQQQQQITPPDLSQPALVIPESIQIETTPAATAATTTTTTTIRVVDDVVTTTTTTTQPVESIDNTIRQVMANLHQMPTAKRNVAGKRASTTKSQLKRQSVVMNNVADQPQSHVLTSINVPKTQKRTSQTKPKGKPTKAGAMLKPKEQKPLKQPKQPKQPKATRKIIKKEEPIATAAATKVTPKSRNRKKTELDNPFKAIGLTDDHVCDVAFSDLVKTMKENDFTEDMIARGKRHRKRLKNRRQVMSYAHRKKDNNDYTESENQTLEQTIALLSKQNFSLEVKNKELDNVIQDRDQNSHDLTTGNDDLRQQIELLQKQLDAMQ